MEKINIVFKIARQYEGEYVFINVLKAFKEKDKVQEFIKTYEFPRTEVINGVGCVCELGIIEDIEVE